MELLQSKGKRQENIISPSTIRRSMAAEEARYSGNNWEEILRHIVEERQANTNPFLRRSSRTGKNKSRGEAHSVFENLVIQGTNRSEADCLSLSS
jgi:hypothetical protein